MPAPQRTFTWSKMIHTNPLDLYVLQAHHRGVLKPFSLVKYSGIFISPSSTFAT
ncbi:UNVERIFIED_CONTAM: hypothetical protein FKN15_036253 [Acipenser sinensis]